MTARTYQRITDYSLEGTEITVRGLFFPRAVLTLGMVLLLVSPLFAVEPGIEVLTHSWHPTENWERIHKTRYAWSAMVQSHAATPRKVSLYYYLLDGEGYPLAMNTMSKIIYPEERVEIIGDSYIETDRLPLVKGSRVEVKTRPVR